MEASFKGQQAANRRKTMVLLVCMFFVVVLAIVGLGLYLGAAVAAWVVPVAVVVALMSVWMSFWSSDAIVLRMTKARLVTRDEAPQLYNLVDEMCIASGLPMPRIAIVSDPAPNAFATGRNPEKAVIAFTTGILQVMDREQLQGVTAHELAHVANRDTMVAAVVTTTAGVLAILSDIGLRMLFFRRSDSNNPVGMILGLVALILAPLAALLIQAAVSRRREALADATAVAMTRNPAGLRRALEELERDDTVVQARSNAVAHMWIESPLDGKGVSRLFSTHPPLSERIAALRDLEQRGQV